MAKKKKPSPLAGFEEFLQENPDIKPLVPATSSPYKKEEAHVLMSFLEKESKRLDKLIQFYSEKAYILNKFPQSDVINIHQDAHATLLQEETIEELNSVNSPLLKSIEELLIRHFSEPT